MPTGALSGRLSRALDRTDRQLATVLAANVGAALDRAVQRREFEAEHDRFAALFENIPDPTIYVEFAIYTDITDQKERELRRQNERLEEFASVVSHDLRNPLNVAQGRLEMARETGDPEGFAAADRALTRMERLIEGLLGLARQGQTVGDTEPVEVAELAQLAWAGVDTGDAELVADDPPRVQGDADRLRQLFENLFRNSIEHADPDVTVTVGTLDDGFYVADDGPGIDSDHRESLFEFGYSGGEGTGFGLAIVEQIVAAHGWRIAVADDVSGEGARFEITGVDVA